MYLVIGGSGYLGRYCVKNILEYTDECIVATYSKSKKPLYKNDRLEWVGFDVCDNASFCTLNERLDGRVKVIYLAAYHHPDKIEENPSLAWDINITSLANAMNRLTRASCLYYASTDSVYGAGTKDKKFIETDACTPINRYGIHKILAEQIVLAAGFNVVRYPFIFGPSLVENRPHFFDFIREELEAGRSVDMFADSYRSTLSFDQCARYLVMLIERYGSCPAKIINISADDVTSKYDVALALADHFNLDKSLVKAISVRDSKTIFKVPRAVTAILDNTLIKKFLELNEIHLEL